MRRVATVVLLLLVVLFGAYTALWFFIADRIADEIAQWAKRERQHKLDVSWETLRVRGYPLAYRVEASGLQLSRSGARTLGRGPRAADASERASLEFAVMDDRRAERADRDRRTGGCSAATAERANPGRRCRARRRARYRDNARSATSGLREPRFQYQRGRCQWAGRGARGGDLGGRAAGAAAHAHRTGAEPRRRGV